MTVWVNLKGHFLFRPTHGFMEKDLWVLDFYMGIRFFYHNWVVWEESACKVIVLFCILETFKDRQSTLAGLENVSKQCNSSATCSHSVQCFHGASQRAISSELFMHAVVS